MFMKPLQYLQIIMKTIRHVRTSKDVFLNYFGLNQTCRVTCRNGLDLGTWAKEDYQLLEIILTLCILSEYGFEVRRTKTGVSINNIEFKLPSRRGAILNLLRLIVTLNPVRLYQDSTNAYITLTYKGRELIFQCDQSFGLFGTLWEIFGECEYCGIDVEGRYILDIGAFVGDSSVYFALQGAKKVYAIEPNPYLFPILTNNIRINMLDDTIYPYNLAMSDSNGNLEFFIDKFSYARSGIYKWGEGSPEEVIRVPVIDIVEFLKDHTVDVIKVDCEGCEYSVVPRLIESGYIQNIEAIILEVHKIGNYAPRELVSVLKQHGSITTKRRDDRTLIVTFYNKR